MPDAPDGSSLWTLGAGALAGLMYLRRFLSREAVNLKKDDAEGNLIQTLQAERDRAMEAAERAWASRAEDARVIGELTSEVRASRELIEQLKSQVGELNRIVQSMRGGNGT